jgi:hypothetical protein
MFRFHMAQGVPRVEQFASAQIAELTEELA